VLTSTIEIYFLSKQFHILIVESFVGDGGSSVDKNKSHIALLL